MTLEFLYVRVHTRVLVLMGSSVVMRTSFPSPGSAAGILSGITHIKLPGSKQRTILDESHRSISHGCRQPSNQAHKTISRRGELAAPGSGGGFHHVCTPFKLLRARTSPLVASLHL